MRSIKLFLVSLAIAAIPAAAQTAAEKPAAPDTRPPALVPVEEGVEPTVTIRQRDSGTIEEYRINGRLYKIKVIPLRGEPYYLVDPRGDGSFVRQDGPGTPGLAIPQWVIGTF